ncbi:MAG: hypothetical protein L6R39_003578 [Caloplaca ligustica]|nr:MAG: hypothetical protein L6R39_003578 [Caloplaca ligustica]
MASNPSPIEPPPVALTLLAKWSGIKIDTASPILNTDEASQLQDIIENEQNGSSIAEGSSGQARSVQSATEGQSDPHQTTNDSSTSTEDAQLPPESKLPAESKPAQEVERKLPELLPTVSELPDVRRSMPALVHKLQQQDALLSLSAPTITSDLTQAPGKLSDVSRALSNRVIIGGMTEDQRLALLRKLITLCVKTRKLMRFVADQPIPTLPDDLGLCAERFADQAYRIWPKCEIMNNVWDTRWRVRATAYGEKEGEWFSFEA